MAFLTVHPVKRSKNKCQIAQSSLNTGGVQEGHIQHLMNKDRNVRVEHTRSNRLGVDTSCTRYIPVLELDTSTSFCRTTEKDGSE